MKLIYYASTDGDKENIIDNQEYKKNNLGFLGLKGTIINNKFDDFGYRLTTF